MKFNHCFKPVHTTENTKIYASDNATAEIAVINNSCIKVMISRFDNTVNTGPKENDSFGFGDIEVKVNLNNFLISYFKGEKLLFILKYR